MKRVWGHVVAALSLVAGAGIAAAACVHNDSTMFVRNALASQYRQNGMVCSYTADPMQPFQSSGVLDIALRSEYEGIFLVGNQMVPTVNQSQLQTETSTISIQGAVIRVVEGGKEFRRFTRLSSATILPAAGGTPSYAPIFITIIDPETIQRAPGLQPGTSQGRGGYVRLVTYVSFFGKTLGGQTVESDEFEYPVDVCNGCLINFTNNPLYPPPNCVANATTAAAVQPQVPCVIGQDQPVDCASCTGINASCFGAYQAVPGSADAGSG